MPDLEKSGILTPHADDGFRVRPDEENAQDLADGLKLVERTEFFTERFAMVARESHREDPVLSMFPVDFFQDRKGFFFHPSEMSPVRKLLDDFPFLVDQHAVEADRSDVNPDVIAFSFFMILHGLGRLTRSPPFVSGGSTQL